MLLLINLMSIYLCMYVLYLFLLFWTPILALHGDSTDSVFVFKPTQTFFVCLANPRLDSDTHRHLSSLTCCSVWLMPSRYVRWERRVAAAMLEWMLRVFDFSPLRHDKTTTVSNNAAMETESEEYVTMARVSRSPSNCCLANREREKEKGKDISNSACAEGDVTMEHPVAM